jgi:hypothetical protein
MRFSILPASVEKSVLYARIVLFDMDKLKAKLAGVGQELLSFLAPTIAVKLFLVKGKPQNGLLVNLLPAEVLVDSLGLGILPLL